MLGALILTIVSEGLVMWLHTRSFRWCRYNLYLNLVTNPLVNIFALLAGRLFTGISDELLRSIVAYAVPFVIGETAVFFSEAGLYRFITAEKFPKCMKYSVITNSVSAGLGLAYFIYTLIK